MGYPRRRLLTSLKELNQSGSGLGPGANHIFPVRCPAHLKFRTTRFCVLGPVALYLYRGIHLYL